ncbi:hypothetical protein ABMA27_012964 [Loxostege sticticalis]|uniref:Uncharacterized protein n=1 Tax=Loxostege sticticalis TaxID=481309 RepID=A0ABR3IDK8_LOXSC
MLVALVASLFALIASAHAQDLCGTDTFGVPLNRKDMMQQLPDVYMPAGSQEVMIDLPDSVCIPDHIAGVELGGVVLRACDYAAAPVVRLTNLRHAVVHRASYSAPGVVHTTVQCVPMGSPN